MSKLKSRKIGKHEFAKEVFVWREIENDPNPFLTVATPEESDGDFSDDVEVAIYRLVRTAKTKDGRVQL